MRFMMFCLSFFSLMLSGSAFPAQIGGRTYTNSIGMEFVLIPAGSFMMGSDKKSDPDSSDDETPHRVRISKPFYLGRYEVTQAQWEDVMGSNPSKFRGGSNPVERVSWNDVQAFIQRLNQREGHNHYRLPTEAEWEYAARAGTTTRYSFGDDVNSLDRHAWYEDNSDDRPHPVGQKEPNPWGLYDMHGNVWEWVQDWYGRKYYAQSSANDPRGLSRGASRVLRGGCWSRDAKYLRSAYRGSLSPDFRGGSGGFRLVFF
ncbi:MAG: formylglycine-generating enzyme family protein [Candidatus Accumulibacter sp.]|nr:formylglycine-generating enzyme family protein [Accumulibacter sp.]